MTEARQRFRGELLRLVRESFGDEVDARVERLLDKMDAQLEQLIATGSIEELATASVEELEACSRRLSEVSLVGPPAD